MPNVYPTIETRYHSPTNLRAARVSARTPGGTRIMLYWDHSLEAIDNHKVAARKLAQKLDFTGRMITGGTKNAYVHLFSHTGKFSTKG